MTTLPKGIQEQIESEANEQYPIEGRMQASTHNSQIEQRKGFIAGAKNYATQLHTLIQENERLRKALEQVCRPIAHLRHNDSILMDLWSTANAALTTQTPIKTKSNE